MKNILLPLLCLVILYAMPANAQKKKGHKKAAEQKAKGPVFKFKDGDTWDFKTVASGPSVTHDFAFTNVGDEPLIIMDATPSCSSCTIPEWPKAPILPGKSGALKVVYKTDKAGPFNKEVYIQSNAVVPNGEKRYTIYIKGVVK